MELDPDGLRVRREVLGDAHVDRAVAARDAVLGAVPGVHHPRGLGRRVGAGPASNAASAASSRSAALVAVQRRGRARDARARGVRNGLTPDEIGEAILHTALYAGLPAANAAFRSRSSVLVEDGLVPRARARV